MKALLQSALLALMTFGLVACGGDGSDAPASSASGASTSAPAAQAADAAAEAASTDVDIEGSLVSFDYSGDFEGSASTGAVIAGRMTDDLSMITANLDGYSSQSDTFVIQLRNEDFALGEPADVYVEDRNTVTLTMDGYALQLQPGSALTVLEKTAETFRAEADELVLTGYEIMDFQRENPSKTVTIRNLRFVYVD